MHFHASRSLGATENQTEIFRFENKRHKRQSTMKKCYFNGVRTPHGINGNYQRSQKKCLGKKQKVKCDEGESSNNGSVSVRI